MKEHAIQFGKWLQNNFYQGADNPNTWKKQKIPNDPLANYDTSTTEQLYDEFIWEYPDGKFDP